MISIILIIVAVVMFVFIGLEIKSDNIGFKMKRKQFWVMAPLVLAFLVGAISIVPVNSVGIIFSPFKGVSDIVLNEGLQIKSPFDKVYIISTEVRTKNVEGVSGQTKDAQWIKITMDIKYRVSETNAFEVFKRFKTLKNVDETLLSPLVQRAIESVTTKYNIIDILGEKRNAVYIEIEDAVKAKLSESGIEFFSLVLTDTDAGEAIEGAITKQAVAKKDTETAMQTQEKASIEANTKVIESEAAAKVQLIQAQAAADANKLMSNSITPEILSKMEMEARIKWGWITIQTGSAIIDTTK